MLSDQEKRVTQLFKMMGNATRYKIISNLLHGEVNVTSLAEMYRKRFVRLVVPYLTKYANAIRYRFILLILLMMFPVVSNASFHFKNLGVSVFPAFSTDGMQRWFNTKFEADWEISDLMELETSAVFLRVNTRSELDIFFKELGLWGILTNVKFKLPWNFYAGAGLGMYYTNFCHYDLDETYMKWKLCYNVSLEWFPPDNTKWGFLATKFELMYFFVPLNLTNTSFDDYYYSHILALSAHFNIFRGKK